jgi:hypothetical protein
LASKADQKRTEKNPPYWITFPAPPDALSSIATRLSSNRRIPNFTTHCQVCRSALLRTPIDVA